MCYLHRWYLLVHNWVAYFNDLVIPLMICSYVMSPKYLLCAVLDAPDPSNIENAQEKLLLLGCTGRIMWSIISLVVPFLSSYPPDKQSMKPHDKLE